MMVNKGPSVLIVEDERIVALDLQHTLNALGYDAFAIASSSDEAIARASERCPDIVLMDIRIKGHRDGIQTAGLLKERFGVPVVYLTAHADDTTIERSKTTEPQGYLVKPVKAAELRSVIEIALYKHEMETRLRKRERWFSTTLRSVGDAVVTVDLSGKVTFMNSSAEALTGLKASEAVGKYARDILRLIDHRFTTAESTPLAALLGEARLAAVHEGSLLNVSTGARRVVSDSVSPVVDRGETLGAVMVFRDVTEQKKLQLQVELADRLASLGTMAAGVAHEVNNPLAIIGGNASFLRGALVDLEKGIQANNAMPEGTIARIRGMLEALDDTESSVHRIAQIVSDLRIFSRPPPPPEGGADVVRCIEWAVRTTAHEFRQRAELITDLAVVPRVTADETRLGQVFINLLMNAAQAIPPGHADRNQVRVVTRELDDGKVSVEIRDSGVGVSKENLKRIFEPFFTTKPVGVGTGLGLSICHGIIRSMGGEIELDSEIGQGTVVRLILPVAMRQPADPLEIAGKDRARLRGRILIVDDEELVRRSMQRILGHHEVHCADNAAEALALIQQGRRFDVILCDVMMPTMTGVEFYEHVLGVNPSLARRIVFVSGGATTAQAEDFLRAVPNLRLLKPFKQTALEEAVQRVLGDVAANPAFPP